MNVIADASLPGLETAFPPPFKLTFYHNKEELIKSLANQDVLLCRANLKVNRDLISNSSLKYVATASSGTDHVDKNYLESCGIQLIDAKGCNASAVADYIESSLAYLNLNQRIKGDKAGIIGMGHVGTKVLERLKAAQYTTLTYDPLKASKDKSFTSCTAEQLFDCDLLCIHAELHESLPYPSNNLINEAFLAKLKPGTVIINASRGGIVNEKALLSNPKPLIYCTDVYLNEPEIDKQIIDFATLCTPHIAGHSLEAKYAAVALVSLQLHRVLGIVPPKFAIPSGQPTKQINVLSIYNPLDETLVLKNANDKKDCFLHLRKNHNVRHDFSLYSF